MENKEIKISENKAVPFEYINLNGKLTLYARKDATEQLRNIRKISITKIDIKKENDIYIVSAYAQDLEGKTDISTGAVSVKGLQGDALANAMMKAETKAKRRVTLSISGLGFLDETEVSTIKGARNVNVDMETGEIIQKDYTEQYNNYIDKIKKATSIKSLNFLYREGKNDELWSDNELSKKLVAIMAERKSEILSHQAEDEQL